MLNKNKTALALGSFVAFIHLVFSVLIFLGWAQPLLNFSLRMHSLSGQMVMFDSFDLTRSVELIVIAFVAGSMFGYIFSTIWNFFNK